MRVLAWWPWSIRRVVCILKITTVISLPSAGQDRGLQHHAAGASHRHSHNHYRVLLFQIEAIKFIFQDNVQKGVAVQCIPHWPNSIYAQASRHFDSEGAHVIVAFMFIIVKCMLALITPTLASSSKFFFFFFGFAPNCVCLCSISSYVSSKNLCMRLCGGIWFWPSKVRDQCSLFSRAWEHV